MTRRRFSSGVAAVIVWTLAGGMTAGRAETEPAMSNPLASILASDPALARIAARSEHEVQIRYTRITRDRV